MAQWGAARNFPGGMDQIVDNSLFVSYLLSINPVADVSCFSARVKEHFFWVITGLQEWGRRITLVEGWGGAGFGVQLLPGMLSANC